MIPARTQVIHQFDKLSNFRDIGGLPTQDGQMMKPGILYRSDELSRITDQDLQKLQQFQIKLICDLRSAQKSQSKPSRVTSDGTIRVTNIPLQEDETQDGNRKKMIGFLFGKSGGEEFLKFSRDYYHSMAFGRTEQVGKVITLLARHDNLPALIHCTAGKDRTGYIAALIQLLVGVPYDAVVEDYLLTNRYFETRLEKMIKVVRWMTLFQVSPERMRLILMARREMLDEVHENLMQKYGSIEKYLCEVCEIEQSTLHQLKSLLLE